MAAKRRLLSKTAFLAGLRCDKLLWIYDNDRDRLPKVDAATQARFDQGHQVGELAKTLYPGGTEID